MKDLSKYCFLFDTSNGDIEYIMRTQPPIIIGRVFHGDIDKLIDLHNPMAVGMPNKESNWAVFYAGKLDSDQIKGTAQEQATQLAKIMRRMSDFYLREKGEKEDLLGENSFITQRKSDFEESKIKKIVLNDAHALSILQHSTFKVPSNDELNSLIVGNFVQVCAKNERFWCEIIHLENNLILGKVDNELTNNDLFLNDLILIETHNIYKIHK